MNEADPQAGKVLKHSTIYAIGSILRQLTSFLMLPVYTHFLTPADYGVVGLLTFTLALIEPLFGARLGDAIPKFYFENDDPESRRSVLSAALTVTSLVSLVAALVLFLFRDPASSLLFGTDEFGLVVGLFGFQLLTQAIEFYGLVFVRIKQRPFLFISISIAKLALQLSLNIWLIAFLNLGVMGVVVSGGLSSALFASGLTWYILKSTGFRFDKTVALRMLRFSWPLWFSGLAGLYIWQSNRFYIRVFDSLESLGLYELAVKFATILTFLFWVPFTQVWDVERFNYHSQPQAREIFSGVFRAISVVLIAAALGISIFAAPAIRIMSAPEFHEAAGDVPFLVLASTFSCLLLFQNFSFLVSSNTKKITLNNYMTMGLITLLNVLFIPRLGHLGAAMALTIAMVFQFLLTWKTASQYFDMNIQLSRLIWPLAIGATGFVLANQVFGSANLWIDIAIKSLIYFICLLLFLWMIWKEALSSPFLSALRKSAANR